MMNATAVDRRPDLAIGYGRNLNVTEGGPVSRWVTDVAAQPRVVLGIRSSDVFQLVEKHLSDLGCFCLCARDRQSFAHVLRNNDLDAAVVDLTFDGVPAVELCQQHPRLLRDVPVLCCASDEGRCLNDIIAAVRGGVSDVMTGPNELDKLDRLVMLASQARSANGRTNGHSPSADEDAGRNGVPGLSNGNGNLSNGNGNAHGGGVPRRAAQRNGDAAAVAANGQSMTVGDRSLILEEFLIGSSAIMDSIRRTITDVAATKATVMIYGESGTGKEIVATAIHRLSKKWDGPFVPINMAAIPDGLAESLLFGHEKGAFTSAVKRQLGHCEVAHNGTLFLDEISEMELQIQPKLLRFLQSGVFQRIGSEKQQFVDARIITATNCDPKSMVKEGKLREDLFFRLHVVPIYVPPLRERIEDIEELAMVFLRRSAKVHQRNVQGFTDEALDILRRFEWPGNVRELENIVERMVIFARGRLVTAEEVPAEVQTVSFEAIYSDATASYSGGHSNGLGPMSTTNGRSNGASLSPIQRRERAAIIEALQCVDGHVVEAAKLMGLGQATVYRKIKQYEIPHKRKRRRVTPK